MEHSTPMQTGIRYGLILGLASIALTLIIHFAGLNDFNDPMSGTNFLISGISWVVIFAIIFFGLKYFRSHNDGQMTLGEGVITSLFIGLISGLILAAFMFVFMAYIAPEFADTMKEAMDAQNEELDQDVAEMQGKIFDTMMSPPVMALMTFINRIFAALIFGLIAALIVKSE